MREMKNSGVEWLGKIPNHWRIRRIKNLFELRNEKNYEALEDVNLISLYEVDLTDEYISAVIGQGRHDNQSFFAFTATPKQQTIETFGTVVGVNENGESIRVPFHVYSMRQAIEEGYVDKKLHDVTAVQTLSRLNRTTSGKNSTFVLDFENTEEDIKGAFLPYYEDTTMEGDTDINAAYDIRNA